MFVKTHNTTKYESILFNFLEVYRDKINTYVTTQKKEEQFKGKSNEQYKGLLLLSAYRLAEIMQKLCNFHTFDYIWTTYNLAEVKRVLAGKGINFDEILLMFNIPNNNVDCIHGSIIHEDGVGELQPSSLITVHESGESGGIVVAEDFELYYGSLEEAEAPTAILIAGSDHATCVPVGSKEVNFPLFDNEYPFIALPQSVDISSIRESFTLYDVTEGYVRVEETFVIEGVDYWCYVYVYATASTLVEPYIINVNYSSI